MRTVKITISILCLVIMFGLTDAVAQWATSGSNIYNTNAGNVGIGTSSPGYLLHAAKNMTSPSIRIQNLGGSGGAGFEMVDNLSGADWRFKATATGGFKIRDHGNSLDVITIEANSLANALYINAAGNVGMGTATPASGSKLHASGGDFRIDETYPFLEVNALSTTGNAGISFMENSGSTGWIFYESSTDLLRINASNSNGYRNDIVILADGRVGIGTATPATGYALSVNGKAVCTEVLVDNVANWPDYVFADDYKLMTLEELERSIQQNNHLPGLPAAAEVEENGVHLGDMQKRLLEKVEELTLYTIEQDKQIKELQMKLNSLENSSRSKKRN